MLHHRSPAVGWLCGMLVLASCGSTEAEPVVLDIQVPADEITLEPAEIMVPSGVEVTLNLVNLGAEPHNLVVLDGSFDNSFDLGVARAQRDDLVLARTVDVEPDMTGSLTVSFDEPGTYQIYCDLPRHYEAGMTGTIMVEG